MYEIKSGRNVRPFPDPNSRKFVRGLAVIAFVLGVLMAVEKMLEGNWEAQNSYERNRSYKVPRNDLQ